MSPLTEPGAEFDDVSETDSAREPRHLANATPIRRARALLSTVPLVIISSLAMSVGLAPPANAATPARRLERARQHDQETRQRNQIQPRTGESAPQLYTVVEGDTISAIAGRFGLSTASVLALNGLSWKSLIFPGQQLRLTDGAAVAAAPAPVAAHIQRYTVVAGDTISGIAQAHGLSTDTVLTANGLDRSSVIYPGQALALPDGAAPPAATTPAPAPAPAAPAPAVAAAPAQRYTVVAGDTISGIAQAHGLSTDTVLTANGLDRSSVIYPGQALTLPDGAAAPAPAPAPAPVAPEPAAATITALSDEMRVNALVIIRVARSEAVSDYGIVIALSAAMQESGLRNVNYGDRDSLGLFQQRPSTGWGTPQQIMDPTTAARSFFGGPDNPHPGLTKGLLDIPGWESMTVSQAAQAVQLSAYPDSYGQWEASARAWLTQLG